MTLRSRPRVRSRSAWRPCSCRRPGHGAARRILLAPLALGRRARQGPTPHREARGREARTSVLRAPGAVAQRPDGAGAEGRPRRPRSRRSPAPSPAGRELKVPARAQALAVAAQLAGDLDKGKPPASGSTASWRRSTPGRPCPRRSRSTACSARPTRSATSASGRRRSSCWRDLADGDRPSRARCRPPDWHRRGATSPLSDVSALPLPPGTAFTVRTPTARGRRRPAGGRTAAAPRCRRPGSTRRAAPRSSRRRRASSSGLRQRRGRPVADQGPLGRGRHHVVRPRPEPPRHRRGHGPRRRAAGRGRRPRRRGPCALGLSIQPVERQGHHRLDPLDYLTTTARPSGEPHDHRRHHLPDRVLQRARLPPDRAGRRTSGLGHRHHPRRQRHRPARGLRASIVVLNEFETPQAGVFVARRRLGRCTGPRSTTRSATATATATRSPGATTPGSWSRPPSSPCRGRSRCTCRWSGSRTSTPRRR